MSRQTEYYAFTGGENLVDPVISMKPGELHDSLNYETRTDGGYRRVDGFERFDGQPSPSDFDKSSYVDLDDWISAVEAARANILPIPGSGAVRGIWGFNGDTYGFRDNIGATETVMYKATVTGWELVPMVLRLDFTAGGNEIFAGDILIGDTSGATAEVAKVVLTSGDWSTSDAAGKICLITSTLTGNFTAAEILKVGALSCATNTAVESLVSFPPGGKFEFINHNFYGLSGMEEMYGANGVGYAFAFDGTSVCFIETGTPSDTPAHIFAHKQHLFLSFPGGSIQHSRPGAPHVFNAVFGASEIAIGEECTGFSNIPGDTLAIFGRNKIELLYGTNVDDWNLTSYSRDAGAIAGSIQSMDVPYFLDDRGLKKLSASMDYGDFRMNTISKKVKPKLDLYRGKLSCSLRVRSKDQYRLFFNEGTILTFALDNGKIKGITTSFMDKIFVVSASVEDDNGEEILYVGDDQGYVYHMDHGNSFDGAEVVAYIRPAFYHFKSPENFKRFMKVVLELEASQAINLTFIPEFSYGDPSLPSTVETAITVAAGSGVWDDSYWESFYWDSQSLSTAFGYLTGIGKNFRMIIKSICTYEAPHTLQGATVHFSRKGYVK